MFDYKNEVGLIRLCISALLAYAGISKTVWGATVLLFPLVGTISILGKKDYMITVEKRKNGNGKLTTCMHSLYMHMLEPGTRYYLNMNLRPFKKKNEKW